MRLMDILPIRLMVLRRTRVVPWFRMVRLMIIRVRRRSLVVVVAGVTALRTAVMFVAMRRGTAVMVVVVPVLCVRRSACC